MTSVQLPIDINSLITELKNHLTLQTTVNEILLETSDSTNQMLVQQSTESMSRLKEMLRQSQMNTTSDTTQPPTQRCRRETNEEIATIPSSSASTSTTEVREIQPNASASTSQSRKVAVTDELITKLAKKRKVTTKSVKKTAGKRKRSVSLEDLCAICLDGVDEENSLSSPFITMECNHVFHRMCLKAWLDKCKTCPTCRKKVPSDHPIFV